MASQRSIMDFINAAISVERHEVMTVKEFTYIRNHGTSEELAEAVERMEAAGGYENLVKEDF